MHPVVEVAIFAVCASVVGVLAVCGLAAWDTVCVARRPRSHGRPPRGGDVLVPMSMDEVVRALLSMPGEALEATVAVEGCDGCLGSVLAVRLVREDGCKPYVVLAREGVSFHPETEVR